MVSQSYAITGGRGSLAELSKAKGISYEHEFSLCDALKEMMGWFSSGSIARHNAAVNDPVIV